MYQFKTIKFLIFFILFLLFTSITFFALDSESRRKIIHRVLVLHDFYRIQSLTYGLQVRDFDILSKRLINYINFSKKFSEGRTYMLPGIYKATELVVSRAVNQEDYNKIEKILKELLKLDNRVYNFHVWYAIAISDNDYEKALRHLDIAIKISPSESEAYRQALIILQKIEDKNLANYYCIKYNNAYLGGNTSSELPTLFNSFNNHKFSIKVNNTETESNFINSNLIIDKNKSYEFILNNKQNLNGLNLYFAPINSLILKLERIEYFSEGKKKDINYDDLIITSNNSYFFEDSLKSKNILVNSKKEDMIRIRHQTLENIEKLNIIMKIKKAQITNDVFCKIYK
jgi:tetratricopeptide (TPR) repeat protein